MEYLICFSGIRGNSPRHMELAKLSLDCLVSILTKQSHPDYFNGSSKLSKEDVQLRVNKAWDRAVALNQTKRENDKGYDPSDFCGAFFWESETSLSWVQLAFCQASTARYVFDDFYTSKDLKGKSRFKGIQLTVVNEKGEFINFVHGNADEKDKRATLGWSFDSKTGQRLPKRGCMLNGDFLNGLIDM